MSQRRLASVSRYLDTDTDTLHFAITRPAIVTDIVGELFFQLDDEAEESRTSEALAKANALKLFVLQLDDDTYRVTIKNALRFELAIQSVANGCSFRQTARVMDLYHKASRNPRLRGLNHHMVSQYARVVLAVSLQLISNILLDPAVWAFSLAADSSTHLGVPLLDL